MAALTPDAIESREDLAVFLTELAEQTRLKPEAFENATLESYLSAASAWLSDIEGFYQNRGETTPSEPSWSMIASIFAAAAVYE